jgi:hypothetical protein
MGQSWLERFPTDLNRDADLSLGRGLEPRGSNLGPTESRPVEMASSRDALLAMTRVFF